MRLTARSALLAAAIASLLQEAFYCFLLLKEPGREPPCSSTLSSIGKCEVGSLLSQATIGSIRGICENRHLSLLSCFGQLGCVPQKLIRRGELGLLGWLER
jgi:hypothetical protein